MLARADYYAFQRSEFKPDRLDKAGPWDIFLSAYDRTDRVQRPFHDICALKKQWIVHEEYRLTSKDKPSGGLDLADTFDPPEIWEVVKGRAEEFRQSRLCIDSTGFIRPHLLVLLWALNEVGVKAFDVLYSDPIRYVADENTRFTTGPIIHVNQVPGYAGVHRVSTIEKDILVIGSGYDYEQIARACEARHNSDKYILIGLPSLQPHMYQENLLRLKLAEGGTGTIDSQQYLYAPANHPFMVAQELHNLTSKIDQQAKGKGQERGNLYLCPVGPKPHVLGFAIYYLRELANGPASIIYPFAESYSGETTQGLRRTWVYRVEL